MTPDERIAALEAENRELRAVVATQASALADAMAERRKAADAKDVLEARRLADRERQRQSRLLRKVAREQAVSRDPVHDSSRDCHVTPPSPPLDGSPLSSKPSLPSPLSSPQPPFSPSEKPDGPTQAELVSVQPVEQPKKQRKHREPTAAEVMFLKIQVTREARCLEAGEVAPNGNPVPERWDFAKQNQVIGGLLKEPAEALALFEAAWGIYLGDEANQRLEPPWSLSYFMTSGVRSKYETRAAREEAA